MSSAESTGPAPSLPSGTVTFVFSDLEGSTRLLRALKDEYANVLQRYHGLLQEVFTRHGGMLVDTAGDGLFYGFPAARGALSATIEAQRALAEHEWPMHVTVRARIGLHTGEAANTPAGFVGMDVHRAARIASAGHGGQILVSQTTRELIGSELPSGATVIDLGEHWLKDLAQPEHLFQVNAPGLPTGFPPLRSLVTLPNNLPRHLTSFVGRRRDLDAVSAMMSEAPLVTLTGPGGVGKTRLALQVAVELLDTFGDGCWFIELETLADGSVVAQQVAVALGVAQAPGADADESLLGHLRTREALLIIDNCEHVIEACAQLANLLLRNCPGLRILATSREPLGVAGERLYPVRSLGVPTTRLSQPDDLAEFEALSLFTERARAADPSFALTLVNAGAVIDICQRLDGIPLAIELAAARVRALTPEQIAERLDDRFRLLSGGSRTSMPRHQTLRAAIEWSFGLLPEAERAVLWRLSAFAGAFTLEAAEAVCIGQDVESYDVADHLTRLVEKSLVNRQGDRYRVLETVRGYAREHAVEAGESEGAHGRHRDWYLELVRTAAPSFFRGPETGDWLNRLEAEHDNLRAALGWSLNDPAGVRAALELAAGLWRFWEMRGYIVEGRGWIERVLAASPGERSPMRADVLTAAGLLSAAQGDHAAALRYHEQSLAVQEQFGDPMRTQFAVHTLANAAFHAGDLDRAAALYERVLEIARQNGDQRGMPFVQVHLAEVADRKGDWQRARASYQEAIEMMRAQDDPWPLGYALSNYGQSAARNGDRPTAREMYESALGIYRQLGDQRGEARVITLLAELAGGDGDEAVARSLLLDALTIRCRLGDSLGISAALERFSAATVEADPERATRILSAAAAMREQSGARPSPADQAAIDQQLARMQELLGARFQEAWRIGRNATVDDALREAQALVAR
ncbi:LuxR family transcriptional regulator [soil metagenome]